jgi:DNA-binding NarL/FixJ family response regulator
VSKGEIVRIVILEDTSSLLEVLTQVFTERGIEVVGSADSHDGALRVVERTTPDVVVVDISLPPDHTDEGLGVAEAIRSRHPSVGLLVLSTRAEPVYVQRLARLRPARGVGYLLKERLGAPDMLVTAVTRVHAGEVVIDPFIIGPSPG